MYFVAKILGGFKMYRKAIKKAKTFILIIMSFVLFLGAIPQVALSQTPFPQHPRPVDYGDVNRDGVISAADITMLRRYIAATDKLAFITDNPSFSEYNADIIGNGVIDAYAVEALREYLSAADTSMMQLGPSGYIHAMEVSSGLYFRDTVYENGDLWYAITPQQTSAYEIVFIPTI
jgi:hypothetical protein